MRKGPVYIIFSFFAWVNAGSLSAQISSVFYRFEWNAVKTIYLPDSTTKNVLNVQGAFYPPSGDFLPVVRKSLSFPVDSLWVEKMESVAIDSGETLPAGPFLSGRYQTLSYRNFRAGGQNGTWVDIIPLFYDTLTGKIRKVISMQINVKTKGASAPTYFRKGEEHGNSVLATGEWFKLAVAEEGIYKIDRSMLAKMGLPVDGLDPARLAIYGNGGKMLPQPNDAFRYDDLVERAIYVKGENDGRFDQDDFILFFAQDPHTHYFDPEDGAFVYGHNVYSDSSFYFLTIGDRNGKRVGTREDEGHGYPTIDYFDDYYIHELDKTNFLYTGREWYGERFDFDPVQNFDFRIRGVLAGYEVKVTSVVMAQAFSPVQFELYLNGETLGTQEVEEVPESTYSLKGRESKNTFFLPADNVVRPDGSFKLNIQYKRPSSGSSKAFLNYFYLLVKRALNLYDGQTIFQTLASTAQPRSTFKIGGAVPDMVVWDITDPLAPVMQKAEVSDEEAVFGVETDTLRRFIAFDPDEAFRPVFVKRVENQNLHASAVPDLLIVSYAGFIKEAGRLADLRRQKDGLQVLVVSAEQVFNEFSSGGLDVTAIRDYCKYLYDRQPGKLKNLLLFGRGSIDYKHRLDRNTNFVPIYTSRNSLHPLKSYSSDDYYGFMDDDEGEWPETYEGDYMMDIGVGRLPVKSTEEARVVVNKLYNYETDPRTLGDWRNQICFVADDGDGNLHLRDADRLATLVDTSYTDLNIQKIYLDAYEQIRSGNGESAPEVNEAIEETMKKGVLIMNYTGHGSETRWASETILNISMINAFDNYERLPLYVTATCEFGRHDDPRIISGGEYLLLNPYGGAIGLVTTSRPVFSSTNYMLNQAFYENVFKKSGGAYPDMGTVFMRTKNGSLNGSINRNFSLLGDPSMKLAYPRKHMRILLNGENYHPADTLKALERVRWSGEVVDEKGERVRDFNGTARITVYDKKRKVTTLGNENPVTDFEIRDNILFRGDVAVDTGSFEVEFIIPRDMDYRIDLGKVSMYAWTEGRDMDANGSDLEFYFGEAVTDPDPDNAPPEIALFINDTTFRSGDVTGPDIVVLAGLRDESGINTYGTGETGGIILILDGEKTYVLNDYYVASEDTYQSGWVTFPLSGLSVGTHQLEIQVADTYNNISHAVVEFRVVEDNSLRIDHLSSAPNPFSDHTSISFEHNRAGDDLEVLGRIFSVNGQKVTEIKWNIPHSNGRITGLEWNSLRASGVPVNSGIYILRLDVRSLRDGASGSAGMKLVVIN